MLSSCYLQAHSKLTLALCIKMNNLNNRTFYFPSSIKRS